MTVKAGSDVVQACTILDPSAKDGFLSPRLAGIGAEGKET